MTVICSPLAARRITFVAITARIRGSFGPSLARPGGCRAPMYLQGQFMGERLR